LPSTPAGTSPATVTRCPSGCGKSTLLDLVGGLTRPTTGRIAIDGAEVTGPALVRAVVFQQYALFPWRTALRNVEFGLEAKGLRRRERAEAARHHLDLVGLSGFEDRYPHELSGGMKQRVAIARSLAYDPGVLLMDEPFAALDAQTRESLQDELLRIWAKTGKTVVFITHGIDEAVYLGGRVAVLTSRPGRVKEIVDIDLGARDEEDLRCTRGAPSAITRGCPARPAGAKPPQSGAADPRDDRHLPVVLTAGTVCIILSRSNMYGKSGR
jgi:NitT/TauT family transport system ATP-binding protein